MRKVWDEYSGCWLAAPGEPDEASGDAANPILPRKGAGLQDSIKQSLTAVGMTESIVIECLSMGSCKEQKALRKAIAGWAARQRDGKYPSRNAAVRALKKLLE